MGEIASCYMCVRYNSRTKKLRMLKLIKNTVHLPCLAPTKVEMPKIACQTYWSSTEETRSPADRTSASAGPSPGTAYPRAPPTPSRSAGTRSWPWPRQRRRPPRTSPSPAPAAVLAMVTALNYVGQPTIDCSGQIFVELLNTNIAVLFCEFMQLQTNNWCIR